jgi:hypothetical protein
MSEHRTGVAVVGGRHGAIRVTASASGGAEGDHVHGTGSAGERVVNGGLPLEHVARDAVMNVSLGSGRRMALEISGVTAHKLVNRAVTPGPLAGAGVTSGPVSSGGMMAKRLDGCDVTAEQHGAGGLMHACLTSDGLTQAAGRPTQVARRAGKQVEECSSGGGPMHAAVSGAEERWAVTGLLHGCLATGGEVEERWAVAGALDPCLATGGQADERWAVAKLLHGRFAMAGLVHERAEAGLVHGCLATGGMVEERLAEAV